jgi:hypothetical protein
MLTSPVSVVAWGLRRQAMGKGLALLLIIAAIIANILLVSFTRSEGVEYFERAWSSLRGGVIVWACLWAMWQVVALAALLWPGPREVPGGNAR